MYKIKGSHAYSHGCYIRPSEYTELWRVITRNARELEISISEYVSHSMHLLLIGRTAKQSKLLNKPKLQRIRRVK